MVDLHVMLTLKSRNGIQLSNCLWKDDPQSHPKGTTHHFEGSHKILGRIKHHLLLCSQ